MNETSHPPTTNLMWTCQNWLFKPETMAASVMLEPSNTKGLPKGYKLKPTLNTVSLR
jgi:hypothetical protein